MEIDDKLTKIMSDDAAAIVRIVESDIAKFSGYPEREISDEDISLFNKMSSSGSLQSAIAEVIDSAYASSLALGFVVVYRRIRRGKTQGMSGCLSVHIFTEIIASGLVDEIEEIYTNRRN